MFLHPDEDPRSDGDFTDERELFTAYLRDHRLTLEMKCAGLTPEQLARRAVEPSTMSLLGLIRHMAEVERTWFRRRMAGQDVPFLFRTAESRDADWDGAVADEAVVAEAWRLWREETAFADRFIAEAPDLMITGTWDGETLTLRELLLHMIEEYARHNGHADLLRERIDGRRGQ
ncbi:MAG: DUF664 domain-containing protein [Streptosporangiales bacterium]|nr:DUF664 domain-containing protein [Streptosporangiales bacterium]